MSPELPASDASNYIVLIGAIGLWVALAIGCGLAARTANRSIVCWTLLSLLLPLIAPMILYVLGAKSSSRS